MFRYLEVWLFMTEPRQVEMGLIVILWHFHFFASLESPIFYFYEDMYFSISLYNKNMCNYTPKRNTEHLTFDVDVVVHDVDVNVVLIWRYLEGICTCIHNSMVWIDTLKYIKECPFDLV